MPSRLGHWMRKWVGRTKSYGTSARPGVGPDIETPIVRTGKRDIRAVERRELIETALSEPDPVVAGEAMTELHRRIFLGADGSRWEISGPPAGAGGSIDLLPRTDGLYEAP